MNSQAKVSWNFSQARWTVHLRSVSEVPDVPDCGGSRRRGQRLLRDHGGGHGGGVRAAGLPGHGGRGRGLRGHDARVVGQGPGLGGPRSTGEVVQDLSHPCFFSQRFSQSILKRVWNDWHVELNLILKKNTKSFFVCEKRLMLFSCSQIWEFCVCISSQTGGF